MSKLCETHQLPSPFLSWFFFLKLPEVSRPAGRVWTIFGSQLLQWPSGKASSYTATDFKSCSPQEAFSQSSYAGDFNWSTDDHPARCPVLQDQSMDQLAWCQYTCDWMRKQVWSATSCLVWQHIQSSLAGLYLRCTNMWLMARKYHCQIALRSQTKKTE